MGNLSDYFDRNAYKPRWNIGDRVQGQWNKIPFRGTVGNDTLINENDGPRVSVHLDLPVRFQDCNHTVIFLKPSQLKEFK